MTHEEKISWLSRYREAEKLYQRLSFRLAEAQEATRHITQNLSAAPGGSKDGQSLARAVEREEEAERRAYAQLAVLDALFAEIDLAFKRFSGYEVLPFWADDDHTRLDCAARLYTQEVWNGYTKETVEKVELFRKDGIHRYIFQNDMLLPDTAAGEYETYFTGPGPDGPDTGYNWERIPLIPFKYNKQELPLIQRVKCLQDAINTLLSDFTNNMQEDARNTILILRNYDGEDLGKFRENLSAYGAVKVRDDGGVEKLIVEVNSDNYKAILDLLKKALIENAKSYDAKDDRLSGNPNQMNIQSMYADIDLDANGMETEFQAAFEDLLWFINKDLVNRGKGDFEDVPVTIVFNRDMLINETESITNCRNSVGLLSNRTIVEQHPWVTDAQTELDRLAEEKAAQAQDDYTPTTFNA